MKSGRYKAVTPVTDFSVSQKIRVALIEDGHTDLAVESITQPIRELEQTCAHMQRRLRALEQEKVNWQTESGVHRILESKAEKTDSRKWKWLIGVLGALGTTLAGALIERFVGKHG